MLIVGLALQNYTMWLSTIFFYVSGDSEHVILFVKHLFGLIYESFKKNVITSIEH